MEFLLYATRKRTVRDGTETSKPTSRVAVKTTLPEAHRTQIAIAKWGPDGAWSK